MPRSNSLFLTALLCGAAGAETPSTPPPTTEPMILVAGKSYPQTEMRDAYNTVRRTYAVDLRSRSPLPAKEAKAVFEEFEVVSVSGQRVLTTRAGGQAAVMMRRTESLEPGTKLSLMVVEKSSSIRVRTPEGGNVSVPQFQDVTITEDEFVRHLNDGYAFKGIKINPQRELKSGLGTDRELNRRPSGFKREKAKITKHESNAKKK